MPVVRVGGSGARCSGCSGGSGRRSGHCGGGGGVAALGGGFPAGAGVTAVSSLSAACSRAPQLVQKRRVPSTGWPHRVQKFTSIPRHWACARLLADRDAGFADLGTEPEEAAPLRQRRRHRHKEVRNEHADRDQETDNGRNGAAAGRLRRLPGITSPGGVGTAAGACPAAERSSIRIRAAPSVSGGPAAPSWPSIPVDRPRFPQNASSALSGKPHSGHARAISVPPLFPPLRPEIPTPPVNRKYRNHYAK